MGSVQSTDKSDKTSQDRPHGLRRLCHSEAPPAPPLPSPVGDQCPPCPLPQASQAVMAEVAAATKHLLDTRGGKSLEILLSPAVKKPKSRVCPPTSLTAAVTQEAIELRLKEAEARKKNIEEERLKSLAAQLAKIDIAARKRGEKVEKIQEALVSKLSAADKNKAKVLSEVKDKVSQHMSKIEKAQKELEASIEAARLAAETSLAEKMDKNEELKSLQMEESLKKIKEHVEKVRNHQEEKLKPYVEDLETTIRAKEERARQNLEKKDAELRKKLLEQSRHAEAVRQNREKIQADGGAPDQTTEAA